MDLVAELERIYDSEINAEIRWFWDGAFTVKLGDKVNGFLAEEDVNSIRFALAPGSDRLLLSSFGLRAIARAGGEDAGGGSRLSPSVDWSKGALPPLRRAERQSGI